MPDLIPDCPATVSTPDTPQPPPTACRPFDLSVVDMVWPDQSNHHGTLFGGAALSFLDRVAFIAASKLLRGSIVTASVGSLQFAAPAPAGHPVECRTAVVRKGRRSITLQLELFSEHLLTGEQTLCLSGEFVMVRKEPVTQSLPLPEECAESTAVVDSTPGDPPMARATVAEIVFPGHANHRGILHGGPAMEWMAKAGFVAATRQVRRALVMASSSRLDFEAPAYVGDVVEVTATVQRVGCRSVHVETQMWAESPVNGQRRHCTTGTLVFVALADAHSPQGADALPCA